MDRGEDFGLSVFYMHLVAPNDFADPWLLPKKEPIGQDLLF